MTVEGAHDLPARPPPPLDVIVSECLLGAPVRYDGDHKRSRLPHDRLARLFTLRGVCPEVGIGLGVPREPIRLVGAIDAPRAVSVADPNFDVTDRLREFARDRDVGLANVAGCVLMERSPSCGLFGVKVFPEGGGAPTEAGRGVFADALARRHPLLPMEDCGRLFDADIRESFIERVFAYAHWRALLAAGLSARRLTAFHAAYKYLLMAHSVAHYRDAGRLLSDLSRDVEGIAGRYAAVLLAGLARPADRGGHANALMHLQGHVSGAIAAAERAALTGAIDAYRRGEVERDVPLEMLTRLLGRDPDRYALDQVYLKSHPSPAGPARG